MDASFVHWGLPLCRPHHYASLTVQCTGTMPKLDIVPVDVFSSPFQCNVCCLGTLYAHMRHTVTHTSPQAELEKVDVLSPFGVY